MPPARFAAAAAVAGLALWPTPAAPAGAPLTATGIRIADHPGFVRVVVDFSGGPVRAGEVVATDPDPFRDGAVRLPLSRRGVRTVAPDATGEGVDARIRQGRGRIAIRLTSDPRRFKYLAYHELHAPERLAFDLVRASPPSDAAEIRRAPDGCLSLRSFAVGPRRVSARGRARALFENSLLVRLRGASGRVIAQQAETAARGRWTTSFGYPDRRRQTGTLEAIADSAKDGTLVCIAQVRVRLGAR